MEKWLNLLALILNNFNENKILFVLKKVRMLRTCQYQNASWRV